MYNKLQINYCVYFRFVNNKSCYRFKDCRFHVVLCTLFWSSSRFNTSLVCPWSASCLKPFCFHQHLLLSLLVKCRISQSPVTVQLQGIQIERTTTKFSASSDGSFCIFVRLNNIFAIPVNCICLSKSQKCTIFLIESYLSFFIFICFSLFFFIYIISSLFI